MTPMVDLFFLLLTFFMLTATFRPTEPVQVDTPVSVSEKVTPEADIITLLISEDGKVFFNIDNGTDTSAHFRGNLLQKMGEYYRINFTKEEISKFEKLPAFGSPMKLMKRWINAENEEERKVYETTGIPMDSTDNQLEMWIHFARLTNPRAEAAIKGDFDAEYKVVKKIFDILQDKKINKFNLTTTLEKVEVNTNEIE